MDVLEELNYVHFLGIQEHNPGYR